MIEGGVTCRSLRLLNVTTACMRATSKEVTARYILSIQQLKPSIETLQNDTDITRSGEKVVPKDFMYEHNHASLLHRKT